MPRHSKNSHRHQKNWARATDKKRRRQQRLKARRRKTHAQLEQTGDLSMSGKGVRRNEQLLAAEEKRKQAIEWEKWQWYAYCDAVDDAYNAQEEEAKLRRQADDGVTVPPECHPLYDSDYYDTSSGDTHSESDWYFNHMVQPDISIEKLYPEQREQEPADINPFDGHGARGAPCGDPAKPTSSLNCETMQWTYYEYDELGNRRISRVEDTRHTPEQYRRPKHCCPACGHQF